MEQTARATEPQGSDRRTWLVGAIIVAALIAIAAAAVLLVGSGPDDGYAPGSPEARVEAYAEALADGDTDGAWQMLSPRAQTRLNEHQFHQAAMWEEDTPTRIWIDERRDLDDRVVLMLSVEWTWDSLLGPDRHIEPLRLVLIELDGAWRIDTPLTGFHTW